MVWAGSLTCDCYFADDFGGEGGSRLFRKGTSLNVVKTAEKASSIAAKKGLDGSMM